MLESCKSETVYWNWEYERCMDEDVQVSTMLNFLYASRVRFQPSKLLIITWFLELKVSEWLLSSWSK